MDLETEKNMFESHGYIPVACLKRRGGDYVVSLGDKGLGVECMYV